MTEALIHIDGVGSDDSMFGFIDLWLGFALLFGVTLICCPLGFCVYMRRVRHHARGSRARWRFFQKRTKELEDTAPVTVVVGGGHEAAQLDRKAQELTQQEKQLVTRMELVMKSDADKIQALKDREARIQNDAARVVESVACGDPQLLVELRDNSGKLMNSNYCTLSTIFVFTRVW